MGKYFGTDGFRGEVNVSLTGEQAFIIGRFLGWYYSEKGNCGKILIGKDTRRSSYLFEYALSAGIVSSGADAYLLHVTTTPSVAYLTRTEKFSLGIMITASHNQFTDNGIKLFNNKGEKVEDGIIEMIEKALDGEMSFPLCPPDKVGVTIDYAEGRSRYEGYLVALSRFSFKGLRIGLDAANGSGYKIANHVFTALGASVYTISDRPNGRNINLKCGSTNPEKLRKLVISKGLDVGFAFDGDADRCIAIDDTGRILDGDSILYLFADFMHSRGELNNDTVVCTVMSNSALTDSLKKKGIECKITAVGDKNVYDELIQSNASLGGENSGHVIFPKIETTGDGIVTAVFLSEMLVGKSKPLSLTAKEYVPYPQTVRNVKVNDKKAYLSDDCFINLLSEEKKRIDGEGRILVRPSGTESVVRILVEGRERENIDKTAFKLADYLDKKYNLP